MCSKHFMNDSLRQQCEYVRCLKTYFKQRGIQYKHHVIFHYEQERAKQKSKQLDTYHDTKIIS